jgi:hypothetical protein
MRMRLKEIRTVFRRVRLTDQMVPRALREDGEHVEASELRHLRHLALDRRGDGYTPAGIGL